LYQENERGGHCDAEKRKSLRKGRGERKLKKREHRKRNRVKKKSGLFVGERKNEIFGAIQEEGKRRKCMQKRWKG